MQRVLITALVVLSIFLGWLVSDLRGRLSSAESALVFLRMENDAASKKAAFVQAEVEPLRANIARLTEERDRARDIAKVQPPASTLAENVEPEAKEPNLFGGLLQSMDSPEMRKMMRVHAVAATRKEYAALIKTWALSPRDVEQFVELMADRDFSEGADAMDFLKGGAVDEKKIAEMETKSEARKKENETRLKSLLGAKRAGELEKFEAEKERVAAVSRYSDHFTTAGFPLDARQEEELGKILRTAEVDAQGKSAARRNLDDAAVFTAGLTDEAVAEARRSDEARQRSVVEHSIGLLSPDQISALQAAFREENDEREMGMKLTAQMMKSGALKNALPGVEGGAEATTQIIIRPRIGK